MDQSFRIAKVQHTRIGTALAALPKYVHAACSLARGSTSIEISWIEHVIQLSHSLALSTQQQQSKGLKSGGKTAAIRHWVVSTHAFYQSAGRCRTGLLCKLLESWRVHFIQRNPALSAGSASVAKHVKSDTTYILHHITSYYIMIHMIHCDTLIMIHSSRPVISCKNAIWIKNWG